MPNFIERVSQIARRRHRGQNSVLLVGTLLTSLMMGAVAVDLPMYFATQRQLQNVVDASALAGAAKLPLGDDEAIEEALELAQTNGLQGKNIDSNDMQFTVEDQSFGVQATVNVPTIFGTFLCSGNCMTYTVTAAAKAVPAARDTMLVLDNSSSMIQLGNYRPLNDVKDAANLFVEEVAAYDNQSVDRVGAVIFNYSGSELIGLTPQNEFDLVHDELDDIDAYNAHGWNTNYHKGLELALNELEQNGRPNANKQIIFLTDGYPNLPAPDSYYNYSYWQPYKKCTDMVHNSQAVQNTCTWKRYGSRWYKVCPTLPSSQIEDWMISDEAQQCGLDYVNHMTSVTMAQVDRAKNNGVMISTITIADPYGGDMSGDVLRRLIKDPDYRPADVIFDYAAEETNGQQFAAAAYDAAAISAIYSELANNIHIKLAG